MLSCRLSLPFTALKYPRSAVSTSFHLQRLFTSHPIFKMPPKDKYTDPKLRDQVKEEIHNSDKGGAPGQWSARKAQMMASEYKKRGGSYNTDKKEQDESQKNLSKWGEEDWQTKEGSGNAKQADGTEKRYLPKKAWENMTEEEKEATEKEKAKGSKAGKQFVGNTDKAKQSREKAGKEAEEKMSGGKKGGANGKQAGGKGGKKQTQKKQDEEEAEDDDDFVEKDDAAEQDDEDEYAQVAPSDGEDDGVEDEAEQEEDKPKQPQRGTKRTRAKAAADADKRDSAEPDKKSAKKSHAKDGKSTYGSKHQSTEAPAPQGSNSRLPKKGQKVTWKAMPGWVEGTVIEVVKSSKTIEGKSIKASKEEPRIALRSSGPSGKVAVHKPDAVFFD